MPLQHNKRYTPPSLWQGRNDGNNALRIHQYITYLDLNTSFPRQQNASGFLGFACEEGIKRNQGRPGAVEGPVALRRSLANIPLHNLDAPLFDCGTITCTDGDLESTQDALAEAVSLMITNGIRPIVLGGGHEMAWGNFQGISRAKPSIDCAIINIDAHFDIRPLTSDLKGTSGTPFQQIYTARRQKNLDFTYACIGIQQTGNTSQLFDSAEEMGIKYVLAESFYTEGTGEALALIKELARKHAHIYLTICLDVFAAPFAPGVSAPQPLGLLPWHVIPLLQFLAKTGKLISVDIAELSPPHDRDNTTATLAAALLAQLL